MNMSLQSMSNVQNAQQKVPQYVMAGERMLKAEKPYLE